MCKDRKCLEGSVQKHETWCASQMWEPAFRCGAKNSLKKKRKKNTWNKPVWFILILALLGLIVLFFTFMGAESHLFVHYCIPGASHSPLHVVSGQEISSESIKHQCFQLIFCFGFFLSFFFNFLFYIGV